MCKARQYSDTMICDPCGLQWDVNDPDPPQCEGPVVPDRVAPEPPAPAVQYAGVDAATTFKEIYKELKCKT